MRSVQVIRVLVPCLVAGWLLASCGEGVAGSQRQGTPASKANDETQLPDGAKSAKGKSEAAGPTRPVVRDVALRGAYAFVLTPDALLSVSLDDPSKPQVVARQVLPKTPLRLTIDGTYAYVACEAGGLQIVALGQPRSLKLIGTYAPNAGTVTAVDVRSGVALVALPGSGVAVVDVSDPSQPVEQKLVPVKGDLQDVLLGDNRGYVLGRDLTILDLQKPVEATVLGTWQIKEKLQALTRAGDQQLVLAEEGLRLVDLHLPERPLQRAALDTKKLVTALGERTWADLAKTPAAPAAPVTVASTSADSAGAMTAGEEVAASPTPAAKDVPAAKDGTTKDSVTKDAAAAATPPAAAAPAKGAPAGKLATNIRLLIADGRLAVLRGPQVYLLTLVDQELRPLARLLDPVRPSCVALQATTLVVGEFGGDVTVYDVSKELPVKLGTVTVASQEAPTAPPSDKTALPVSPATQTNMNQAPDPSTTRPKNAPQA